MKFTALEIARITGGKLSSRNKEGVVSGFSTDSRSIQPGQFFIAIKGRNFDGHDFTHHAVQKKASGLIVEHLNDKVLKERVGHIIVVEDTRRAMGKIASAIRRKINIPVICITGTNGKTTVKDILAVILSSKYSVLKSNNSYNNIIGVSLTLFGLTSSYDVAILELGTNHPGEIAELAEIAAPDIAVITNIGNGHLEHLSDRKGVFAEKTSLLNFLPAKGKAFLNKDDDLLAEVSMQNISVKFFGTSQGSDFLLARICKKREGYEFYLNNRKFFLPFTGIHNVYNAAAAVSVAECFNIDYERIYESLKRVSLPEMRLEKTVINRCIFVNDSYNANPESFEYALKFLEDSNVKRKGVVAGDMMELGEKSIEFHRIVGKSIAKKNIDFLIVIGVRAMHIADAAIEEGMQRQCIIYAEDHKDAAQKIRRMADAETMILLKGSRMARMEEVLKCYTTFYTL